MDMTTGRGVAMLLLVWKLCCSEETLIECVVAARVARKYLLDAAHDRAGESRQRVRRAVRELRLHSVTQNSLCAVGTSSLSRTDP